MIYLKKVIKKLDKYIKDKNGTKYKKTKSFNLIQTIFYWIISDFKIQFKHKKILCYFYLWIK